MESKYYEWMAILSLTAFSLFMLILIGPVKITFF